MNSVQPLNTRQWQGLFGCWLVAATATAASLFLSEVMDYVPCMLCWYQRVPMYALVVVLAVGLYAQDPNVFRYAKPLALIGIVLAVYHCLLYLGIIPEGIKLCGKGPSCAKIDVQLWNFVTIPLLSAASFIMIYIGLFFSAKQDSVANKS